MTSYQSKKKNYYSKKHLFLVNNANIIRFQFLFSCFEMINELFLIIEFSFTFTLCWFFPLFGAMYKIIGPLHEHKYAKA